MSFRFLLVLLPAVFLQSAWAKTGAEIPFELRDGLICLNVKVATTNSPLRFVLDSGAGMSALNLDAARRLKVRLGGPAFVVGVGGGAQARWVHGFAAKIGDVPLFGDLLFFDLRQINPGAARGIITEKSTSARVRMAHNLMCGCRLNRLRTLSPSAHSPPGG